MSLAQLRFSERALYKLTGFKSGAERQAVKQKRAEFIREQHPDKAGSRYNKELYLNTLAAYKQLLDATEAGPQEEATRLKWEEALNASIAKGQDSPDALALRSLLKDLSWLHWAGYRLNDLRQDNAQAPQLDWLLARAYNLLTLRSLQKRTAQLSNNYYLWDEAHEGAWKELAASRKLQPAALIPAFKVAGRRWLQSDWDRWKELLQAQPAEEKWKDTAALDWSKQLVGNFEANFTFPSRREAARLRPDDPLPAAAR